MKELISFAFGTFCLLASLSNVFGELASPRNVAMETLNTNYVLKWDWDQETAGNQNVTFTVEYIARFKISRKSKRHDWTPVCVNVPERHCDISEAELHYLGLWVLRVQARQGQLRSAWVEKEFCPDKDATIGPPSNVSLNLVNGFLEVMISDPLDHNNKSMKEMISHLRYVIQYWKHPSHAQKPFVLEPTANIVVLPDLENWTLYCVRVQSRYDYYNKSSVFSPTQCMQTEGPTSYLVIFLYFLLSLMLCFLMVLLVSFTFYKVSKIVKTTFFPSIQLPTPIQEYLSDSPSSDLPCLLTPESEQEIFCDRLEVVESEPVLKETVVLEVHIPPTGSSGFPLEQDSGKHSRHGSGDSGMYSTEESSASRCQEAAPPYSDGFVETPAEEMKMVKIGRDTEQGETELDEGVRDVCI
ncbi:interferon alpha/beta receptor 1b [Chanos chanos]|uniref:Interferon alpha/beta receptor 1b n=1 Tax=Chanos chanos TaxID=29144 RepID=A0A6J2WGM6_CHACN|nr:interferon alpha/beta receptor 1b-like [Chanos chanos]